LILQNLHLCLDPLFFLDKLNLHSAAFLDLQIGHSHLSFGCKEFAILVVLINIALILLI